jgi:putative ABC transport system permease protein
MIRNYFKAAIRNILKNKVFSFINVLGLAIGMAACLLIAQYVVHEVGYDQFFADKERIFRIQLDRYDRGEISTRWAAGCVGIGPALKANFPEVEDMVRMEVMKGTVANGDKFFREDKFYLASEHFFKMFSLRLLKGVDSIVLKEPYKIVLSETIAKKYFGDEDPIGKILKINGSADYEVTGVFEDIPGNSHMRLDALVSFNTYLKWVRNADDLNTWQWDGFMTYIKLDKNSDWKAFEAKLPAFVQKQKAEELKKYNADMVFHLEPITTIHLYSPNLMWDYGPNGNGKAVYFLGIIAIFILVIAWINYINLATARSMERAREVGVRKVMGSFRIQIIRQFLFESFLVKSIALLIAIVLVWTLLPYFSELAGQPLKLTLFSNPKYLVYGIGVFVAGILLAGLYPAFVMSGFKPVVVLKGRLQSSAKGAFVRKGLVVFQFVASVALIVGTFTVYTQLRYMRTQDLGFNVEQTLVLNGPNVRDSTYDNRFAGFQNDLLSYPEIQHVTCSSSVPGRQPGWNAGGIRRIHETSEQSKQYRIIAADYDFVPTFDLKMMAGRNFSKEIPTDRKAVIFNESAVKFMGFKNFDEALDEQIYFWGDTFKIVGVMKDYRQESLKKNFEPLIFRCIPDASEFYSLKIKSKNIAETIALAEQKFKEHFPGNPFQFFFLDDYYNQQYQADQQFGKVFGVFAALAILIACLGLFGLSSYTVVQRTKEIGVRKVLGATVSQVVNLLFKDFAILIAAAILFAIPASWWIMTQWLSEFANRIDLSWWIFAIPSLIVMCIAWLTISLHTYRAASANPVDSLRYE